MSVDWFTTIAQIVNFLVLVYLLKRFLYQPIVKAMSRREETIAGRMSEAEGKVSAAQQQIDAYQQKQREFDQQREAMLADARREAEATRSQLLDELRAEIARIRQRWQQEVEREQKFFITETRQVIADQVCEVARHALRELANVELEHQIIRTFEGRLSELSAQDKAALMAAEEEKLILQSQFPLSDESRRSITSHLQQQLSADVVVHFEQVPDLLCGIRLKRAGFKLEWNLENYLAELDAQLRSKLALTSVENP